MVVTGGVDGTARMWNGTTLACTHVLRNGHVGHIMKVAIAPNSFIVTAGKDRTIVVWNPITAQEVHTIRRASLVSSYGGLAALGNIVAWHNRTDKKDEIVCYDVSAREEMFRVDVSWRGGDLPGRKDLIIKLTPQFLFASAGRWGKHPTEYVKYWDLGTGTEVGTLCATPRPDNLVELPGWGLTGLLISQEEGQVIGTTPGGLIMVWQFDKGSDKQQAVDRMRVDADSAAPLLEDDDNAADEWDGDSDDSDMGYGNYGPNFVPRGRKYWRQG